VQQQSIGLKSSKKPSIIFTYRPREKLHYSGTTSLSNAELLAIILSSGHKNLPVLNLAQKILKKFPLKLLHELFTLKKLNREQQLLKDLQSIPGIAFAQATKIIAAIELGRRSILESNSTPLRSPLQVFNHCSDLKAKKQEYCLAFFLNGQQELLLKKTITIGGLNFNYLEGREIFEIAFQLQASNIILVHNHPSGNLEPSMNDLLVSKKLAQLAEAMGVKLIDHLIISRQGYFSIREEYGDLKKIDC
jgi:DNA repair protein RadC